MSGGPLPPQEARLHLAHDAGQQRRQQQHQQHLRALHGEVEDHGHIASTSSRTTRAAKTRLKELPDGQELQVIEPVRGEIDAARRPARRACPRRDRAWSTVSRAGRMSPGGGISTCSRARNTTLPNTRRIGWAKLSALYWVDRSWHPDSRSPTPARDAVGRRRGGGSHRRRASPRCTMNRKTRRPL